MNYNIHLYNNQDLIQKNKQLFILFHENTFPDLSGQQMHYAVDILVREWYNIVERMQFREVRYEH